MAIPPLKIVEAESGRIQVSRGNDPDSIGVLIERDGRVLAAVLSRAASAQLCRALMPGCRFSKTADR
jgi:hypothetical protein